MGFNSAFKGLNIVCHTLCKRDCVNWTVSKLTLAYSKPFELSTDIIGLGVHIRNLRDFPLFHVSPSTLVPPSAVQIGFVVFWCLHKASGQIDTGLMMLLAQCQQVTQLLKHSFDMYMSYGWRSPP
jgi:hypothetical protein